ncbi:hypothetical protein [Microvirga brassicacearum]|uniref:hypothetical protein n=1 Tax=Microvirga brassicacearum TaxID=2580413 RepID=UPI001FCE8482|nr:hypothetical protein [Microvirga brassicacearum]
MAVSIEVGGLGVAVREINGVVLGTRGHVSLAPDRTNGVILNFVAAPTQSGQVCRLEAGQHSGKKPNTVPINFRTLRSSDDPEINRSYGMMAHDGVGILSARSGKPRDKAKVENGLRFAGPAFPDGCGTRLFSRPSFVYGHGGSSRA